MNYTILVTNACNLRCSYCYENNKSNKKMSTQTANHVINFIKKTIYNDQGRKHRIIFHGGEPFLNLDIIKYIKKKLDNEIDNSINIIYQLTTNGTIINDSIIDFIKNNNIHLSISIDGTKESHNTYRVFDNGAGSYDVVIKNLKYLVYNGIIPRCRMTFSSNNFKDLHKGILTLKDIGLNLFAISENFFDKAWTKNLIIEFKDEIKKLIKINNENNIHISLVDKECICKKRSDCFGGITTFAISPIGSIYPCVFNVCNKKFIIGSVYNFDYQEIVSKMSSFHRKISRSNSICKECEAIEICSGSKCKLLNYMVTKSYGTPPSITCELMKIELETYKNVVMKEVL